LIGPKQLKPPTKNHLETSPIYTIFPKAFEIGKRAACASTQRGKFKTRLSVKDIANLALCPAKATQSHKDTLFSHSYIKVQFYPSKWGCCSNILLLEIGELFAQAFLWDK
jgi:hypothetical protein